MVRDGVFAPTRCESFAKSVAREATHEINRLAHEPFNELPRMIEESSGVQPCLFRQLAAKFFAGSVVLQSILKKVLRKVPQ